MPEDENLERLLREQYGDISDQVEKSETEVKIHPKIAGEASLGDLTSEIKTSREAKLEATERAINEIKNRLNKRLK